MNEIFDFLNLVFMGLVVFILFRLWLVLGKCIGNECLFFDFYFKQDQDNGQVNGQDNVILLFNQGIQDGDQFDDVGQVWQEDNGDMVIDKMVLVGIVLNGVFKQILFVDCSFEFEQFL